MYTVLKIPKSEGALVNDILSDDEISRQSIYVRDSDVMGLESGYKVIMIEGNERVIEDIEKKYPAHVVKEKDSIAKKIKEEDSSIANGLGSLF